MARQQQARQVATIIFVALFLVLIVLVGWFGIRLVNRFAGGSSSGEAVAVPDLNGLGEEEAEQALRALSLVPRPSKRDYSGEQPAGKVFSQKPAAGARVKPGNKVTFWVSLGPRSFTIPNLVGERIEDINQRLSDVNLSLGKIEKVIAPGMKSGQVISQRPEAGSEYNGVVPVDIVVVDNENIPDIVMPTLTGKRLADVERSLVDSNLHLAEVHYVANDEAESGTVTSQSIAPNEQVRLGSAVSVEVAVPTELFAATTRTVNLRITVPIGPEKQRVRIRFTDSLGQQDDYDEEHARGHTIERTLAIEGPATISIFINDMKTPYRVETL